MEKLLVSLSMSALLMFVSGSSSYAEKSTDHCTPMCKKCQKMCKTSYAYFKKKGGKYMEKSRVDAIKTCIKTCHRRKTDASAEARKECAEACNKCAEVCEELNDPKLKDCVAMCRECADGCTNPKK